MGSQAKVLIADDNDDVRELLQDVLEEAGYRVCVARDGAEALVVFLAEAADVVITDLLMPKQNGLQVLAAVTASRPGTPVVVLTGQTADSGPGDTALQAGAFASLTKPLRDISLIAHMVAAALAARPAGSGGFA